MKLSMNKKVLEEIFGDLKKANEQFTKKYPGNLLTRQPVHTVYGGAHLFKANTIPKLGLAALNSINDNAVDFVEFAKVFQFPGWEKLPSNKKEIDQLVSKLKSTNKLTCYEQDMCLSLAVYERVIEKLKHEAIEDFRIDFEDGYGNRTDEEEDGHAVGTARELAQAMKQGTLSPFIGFRVKPLTEELKARSVRTLDIFLSELFEKTQGTLPPNFIVTLPKVTNKEQVIAFIKLLNELESKVGNLKQRIAVELMMEAPQLLVDRNGHVALASIVEAAEGRCTAVHLGPYDYMSANDIVAGSQRLDHPACDFARELMRVTLSGTGIHLSDGPTNVLPIGPYRVGKGELTENEKGENKKAVHQAWKLSYHHIMHALKNGYYQGWDLHPAQLPARYAAYYVFFLQELSMSSLRLHTLLQKAAQGTLVGNIFDDAASGQGLLNYFLRAINCGAITAEEVKAAGLTVDELRTRSFFQIMQSRQK
jgi:citrate lyase beta subunit